MYKTKVLLVTVLTLSIVSVSYGLNVVYVDVNGPNDPGTGSYEDPFRRIQDGIDSADNNDTVIIAEGVYTGNGNYDLDPNGKSITIRSTEPNDPEIVGNTIIDPNGAGRGFYFHSGEDANCVVSGLTIKNAEIAGGLGAGIYCDNSSPTIVNCVITDNLALYGGGVFCNNSNPQFKGCTISDNNSTSDGAGLECWSQGNPKLINCIISNNRASGNGGGIDCWYSNPILINCTIVKNFAASGGGIYCDNGELIVKSSIFWANESNTGEQLALVSDASVSVSYCDVQGGQTAVYDPCDGLVWGSGNIDADPCFASFDPNGEPNMWDFHPQSAYGRWDFNVQSWVTDSNTSPCIDAGDPNSDYISELWPHSKQINMGAYGGTPQASMSPSQAGNIADLNNDDKVNFEDLDRLTDSWLIEQVLLAEDLDRNGAVNFSDFAIFADNWLWQGD